MTHPLFEIEPTIVIPTGVWLIFSKLESIEFAWIIFASDLNGYEIFIIQLINTKDFCGDGSHLRHFRGNKPSDVEPAFPILFSIG
jgi:hypothetical protein